jgi:DNA-binding NtrC family response regulator
MPSDRVLFVDDDEAVLRTFCAYFERRGHQALRAASGDEGIRIWDEERPDVAVIDMVMPGMSGFDVLRQLRSSGAVVIVLTAYGDIEMAMTAMKLGAENFLTKPIEMEHLAHAVENAAEKARLRRENAELRSLLEPNTRRRIVQGVVVVVLLLAALALGRIIGGVGDQPPLQPGRVAVDGLD